MCMQFTLAKIQVRFSDQYGYTTPTRNRNVSQLYAISRNVGVILEARASQTRVRQRNW